DSVEISCHGGPLVSARILELLWREGARPAREGEFTLRAFLSGKMDLTQAEAVEALIQARSTAGARAALRVLGGGLGRALDACLEALTGALVLVESQLDLDEDAAADPEEVATGTGARRELDSVGSILSQEHARLESLLAGSRTGRLLEEGMKVALVGRPNAGKSSLFNAFLSRDRAIVSPEPGTTRDALEGWVEWDGVPVAILDTAGLRSPETQIEQEGIRRTREAIASAAIVILVVDISRGNPGDIESEIADLDCAAEAVVVALHKWDLAQSSHQASSRGHVDNWLQRRADEKTGPGAGNGWRAAAQGGIPSSVVGKPGVEDLRNAVKQRLVAGVGDPEETVVVGERQRHLLKEAQGSIARAGTLWERGAGGELVAFELRSGLDKLGELMGRRVGPLVLDRIFSRFCVGK
ncbi:MAG: 50S ribosome-binding GTPase, partial [Candidatus Eisenbacteria sp.]|nr:50S ribosome-binding GTPase [Candidatus Eisenbacteria bacterium]